MNEWVLVTDRMPEFNTSVRLKLKDAGGEYESPYECRLSELDEEFYNVESGQPVKVSDRVRVIAWRPIRWRGV